MAGRIAFTMKSRISKVTGEVVVVFPNFDDYSYELLSGLVSYLEVHRNFTPLFLSSRDSELEDLPDFRNRISGVITWANPDDRWIYPFLEDEIPVINCGTDWLGEKRVHSVFNDHAKVELVAIDHFVELGMDNVSMALHDLSQHHGMERRVKAFEDYARSLELNPSILFIEGELPDYGLLRLLNSEGETQLRDRLQQLPKPCGILCENDHQATLICRVATHEGIQIPRDIAVLGYGDHKIGRFAEFPVSTLGVFGKKVGSEAARLMSEILHKSCDAKQPTPLIDFGPAQLIVRDSTGGKLRDPVIERCYRRIQQSACSGITVKDLLAMSNLSRPTLVTKFREAFGIHPSEEIRRVRLDAAKQMLAGSRVPILEISRKCGFHSQTSFSNFFLRCTGVSPSEYRRR